MLRPAAAGENKPLKYPTNSNKADVARITKVDLVSAVEFNQATARQNFQTVRLGVEVFTIFVKTGERMAEYQGFLDDRSLRLRGVAVSK